MELRHLKSFVCIASEGSFSRAALRLHIAQPALSQHIRQLEEELGVSLFIRHPRGIELSPQGLDLLPEVEEILAKISSLRKLASNQSALSRVQFRLGLPTTVIRVLGPSISNNVESKLSHVNFELVEGMTGFLYKWLSAGELDAAILYDQIFYGEVPKSLVFLPLIREEFSLITPKGFFEKKTSITPAVLQQFSIVLPRKLHAIRALIGEFTKSHNISLQISREVDSFPMLIDRVRMGDCTLLPAAAVLHELAEGQVEAWPIHPAPFRTLNVCYAKSSTEIDIVKTIVIEMIDTVERLTAEGKWRAEPCGVRYIP